MKRTTVVSLALLCLGAMIPACIKVTTPGGGSSDKQDLQMMLTDDPPPTPPDSVLIDAMASITAVNVDIESMSIMMWSDTDHWEPLDIMPGVYNLLNLRNGMDTALGTTHLKKGQVKAIKVVFGNQSSVTANGINVQLGLLFAPTVVVPVTNDTIQLGDTPLQLWMDIDAGRSIVELAQGNFGLKPFIRLFTTNSASIKGIVMPHASAPLVGVISGSDTLVALPSFTGDSGMWEIRGIKTATVNVFFHATASSYHDTALLDVPVVRGTITDVGSVELKQ
ncbi:DUF4382 domain-containing protein [Dinghuibacter silviterrae]|uniref:Uncharacterized protein DUF4382 n=1 Tax=Dinghuibacter silviterrae TaxID=1539049 RepID=A0A4R8DT54_9BACT|nr:DUF4382 domain-containing protein [Dinghuibacter silviterrae]TDX01450.1 uncharacterized protein DUF4382 [Dinghuibacter silviterrae]